MIDNEYKVKARAVFRLCAQDDSVANMLSTGHILANALKLLFLNKAWLDLLDFDGGHSLLGRQCATSKERANDSSD